VGKWEKMIKKVFRKDKRRPVSRKTAHTARKGGGERKEGSREEASGEINNSRL